MAGHIDSLLQQIAEDELSDDELARAAEQAPFTPITSNSDWVTCGE